MFKLRVEAEVKPTEDEARVKQAVKNIFPSLELRRVGSSIVGESGKAEALGELHRLLRLQAILDSARRVMLSGARGDILEFKLNKQAATVKRVSFDEGESALGPIKVFIQASNLKRLIDYLAPQTREGKPMWEITYSPNSG